MKCWPRNGLGLKALPETISCNGLIMIICDEIISWRSNGDFDSQCRLRIVKINGNGNVKYLKNFYVVVSDLGMDSGVSITNAAGYLIPFVCREHRIELDDMIWFEHYPHKKSDAKPTLDVVTPKPMNSCCGAACSAMLNVEWRPARHNEITHIERFIPDILQLN